MLLLTHRWLSDFHPANNCSVALARALAPCLLAGLMIASTLFSGPVIAQETPALAAAPASEALNPLEQMENVLTGIVKQARGCVVSIAGHVAPGGHNILNLRVHSGFSLSLPDLSGLLPTGQIPPGTAGEEAEADRQKAIKTLRELPNRINRMLGVPTTGSGFLLSDGIVVTTAEVAAGMQDPTVIFPDGRHVKPSWVNVDSDANVAVFKLDGLPSDQGLAWGEGHRVQPGSFAITLGNQGGFGNSVTLGLVAALSVSGQSGSRHYRNLIQFQGTVGDGGSGAPLLNARGQVIGMVVGTPAPDLSRHNRDDASEGNSDETGDENASSDNENATDNHNSTRTNTTVVRRHKRQTDNANANSPIPPAPPEAPRSVVVFSGLSNVGFALPVTVLQPLVTKLLQNGGAPLPRRGWLGIKPPEETTVDGALIQGVYIGGPADEAGLEPGDIIVSMEGEAIHSWADMKKFMPLCLDGATAHLKIRRGQTVLPKELHIKARPDTKIIDQSKVREKPEVGDAGTRRSRNIAWITATGVDADTGETDGEALPADSEKSPGCPGRLFPSRNDFHVCAV